MKGTYSKNLQRCHYVSLEYPIVWHGVKFRGSALMPRNFTPAAPDDGIDSNRGDLAVKRRHPQVLTRRDSYSGHKKQLSYQEPSSGVRVLPNPRYSYRAAAFMKIYIAFRSSNGPSVATALFFFGNNWVASKELVLARRWGRRVNLNASNVYLHYELFNAPTGYGSHIR